MKVSSNWDHTTLDLIGTVAVSNAYDFENRLVNRNDLIATGNFSSTGDFATTLNRLARWDGTNWAGIGGGLDGPGFAMAIGGSNLYVGGFFSAPGNRIAKWGGPEFPTISG